ncbi:MAG TPA: M20/M25/M40 family metallo-hydrolase [Thermoplasmata archaeon]|nr:M20/M25/M40 family metallo-hydrolase [Thermoplasmata archaeon]
MSETSEPARSDAAGPLLRDPEALRLLSELVAIAPTNLEDPVRSRYEKPYYRRAADEITRWARTFGLRTRRFDPVLDLPPDPEYRGIPRPNVIVDLDGRTTDRLLILVHYDVVPVPREQLSRWKTPPHVLTRRSDGRLYARGANDDLGSGVLAGLFAMKRLAGGDPPERSVRMLVCCDEETGGLGGIDAVKRHDEQLPPNDPDRFLDGSVALIPDGSPHTTAGSSGIMFLDGTFDRPATVPEAVAFGSELARLHDLARTWRSIYASPDWPDHGAPEPVLTGRATLTRFDVGDVTPDGASPALLLAHAENEAPNQIAESVTLVFGGEPGALEALREQFRAQVKAPFRLESPATSTSLEIPPGGLSVQIVGQSAHGGYPHRGHNPVPVALDLLARAVAEGRVSRTAAGRITFAVDLRLIPELALERARHEVLDPLGAWCRAKLPGARVEAPPARSRGGYSIPPDHPAVARLERIARVELGERGVFGEYGGTDASTLSGVTTPTGAPLPALVFGSMDREARIHEAEESVDPRLIEGVSRTLERFAREP